MPFNVKPKQVRYIKLGEGGRWEQECIRDGIIRFGFGSANAERFPLCRNGKWAELKESFIAQDKDVGTVTRFTNETRLFFEDDGTTLWITFVRERLYWGLLTTTAAERHRDGDGVFRDVKDGWRWHDLKGSILTKERLPGALNKFASYRGTSCRVDIKDQVVRRINGQKNPAVERAISTLKHARGAVLELVRQLGDRDFEILVDLAFSASGWRRLGGIGKTQKMLDLDLELPIMNKRAFVQVKSKTSSRELAKYVAQFEKEDQFDHMFFVHHSGKAETESENVTVIGPDQLAQMVIDTGLTNWVIRKI